MSRARCDSLPAGCGPPPWVGLAGGGTAEQAARAACHMARVSLALGLVLLAASAVQAIYVLPPLVGAARGLQEARDGARAREDEQLAHEQRMERSRQRALVSQAKVELQQETLRRVTEANLKAAERLHGLLGRKAGD